VPCRPASSKKWRQTVGKLPQGKMTEPKIRMPNVECRMKPEFQNPKMWPALTRALFWVSGFGFLSDFEIRDSGLKTHPRNFVL